MNKNNTLYISMKIKKEYWPIILLSIILIVILSASKDMECVLMLTGIIVNVIAISMNTGATKFLSEKNNNIPNTFLPVRRKDLVDKFNKINREKEREKENEEESEEESEVEVKEVAEDEPQKEKFTNKPDSKYKGAVDFEEEYGEMYPQTGTDGIPRELLKHQGINTMRQISGAMKRRRMLAPYITAELIDTENMPWWGAYDEFRYDR